VSMIELISRLFLERLERLSCKESMEVASLTACCRAADSRERRRFFLISRFTQV